MDYLAVAFLEFVVALHLGYRIGHQMGFEEGLSSAAKLGKLDRQDCRVSVFGHHNDDEGEKDAR